MATTNPSKVTTGIGRFCYTQNAMKPNEDGSYSMMALIPKSDKATVDALKKTIESFKKDPKAEAKWGSKFLASMRTPLRDGDAERDTEKAPEFKGNYFFNANTYSKPGVVDGKMNEIIDPNELYSGCYGRVSVVPAAYNVDGNKGIKFYLNNIQKVREGDKLGGGAGNVNDDFTAVEEDFLS